MNPAMSSIRQQAQLCIGKAGVPVGTLIYTRQGQREHSAIAYGDAWLSNPARFSVSADLPLTPGYQPHKAGTRHEPVFHGALADTMPDAWGRRVIRRDHARRRKNNPRLGALTEMDYLLAVDDFSRVGALRLRDSDGHWYRTVAEGMRSTPPLIDLAKVFHASRALELGQETAADLRYLEGKGTSLGGMRPKCTVLDADGQLAIGKFPSVDDARSVTRAEVLALRLAQQAGIDAASSRIVEMDDTPVAVIRRFDRDDVHGRIPYQSAASLLQASREDDHSYVEMADAIRSHGHAPTQDVRQLWRRMAFNLLITNVDDHLQNHGFLHVEHGLWRLAPAFDINPFPDKDRESKTWLSEDTGPITDIRMLLAHSTYFSLSADQALATLAEVYRAVSTWREVACSPAVGLAAKELDDFAPAFEHAQARATKKLLDA